VSALILGWNREKWDRWETPYDRIADAMCDPGFRYRRRWSVGARRDVAIGTDAWLLRQGRVRGLIGHGATLTEPVEDVHFWDPNRTRRYVEVEFDALVREADVIPPDILQTVIPEVAWPSQFQSGNSIPPEAEHRLLELWNDHVASLR